MMQRKLKIPGILIVTAKVIFGGLVLGFLYLCLKPVKIDSLVSHSRPSASYQESLERIMALEKSDTAEIIPSAKTIVMSHGAKTENVIVFFHGFTNSPRQFAELGKNFYDQGFNVLIPRIPYHGFHSPQEAHLARLTAEDLVKISDEAVDIAQGLGEHVVVAGLSMGGVMAGWVAQTRGDVEQAVLIAPSFGTYRIPDFFLKPTTNLLILKRDSFVWWDKKMKNTLPRPETAYWGFSTRALGEIRRLGYGVQILASRAAPRTKSILIVTNANDHAVNKEGINAVIGLWEKKDHVKVKSYEFPKDLKLGHDIIDPQQKNQQIAVVYPKLLELIVGMK